MKNSKKHIISAVVMILLIILTFYIVLKGVSFTDMIQAVGSANPLYLIFAFVFMLGYVFCEALNIKAVMKTLDQPVTIWRCVQYAFAGFFFSSITPSASGGQPAQVYFMKKDGVPVCHSSLVFLLITVAFQVIMLLYGVTMLLLQGGLLKDFPTLLWIFVWFGALCNLVASSCLLAAVFSKKIAAKIALWTLSLLAKLRLIKDKAKSEQNLMSQLDEYARGAEVIRKSPVTIIKLLSYTTLQKTLFYAVPFMIYLSFGLKGHTAMQIIGLQALLTIAICMLPLPGAVGASESGFMQIFNIIFPVAIIVPAMLLDRLLCFYIILILSGLVCLFMYFRQRRKASLLEADTAGLSLS